MTDPDTNESIEDEYVRRKAKIQVGDGPDQRGEVTVEIVTGTENLGESFADWQQEIDRSTRALRDELGLPDPDDEVGGE